MKSLTRFFSSVKLAIVLFIVITIASILGTLIPQLRVPEFYNAKYGGLAPVLMSLDIVDLYHSWWYIGLLLMFSINIIVCSLSRLAPKLKRYSKPKPETDPKKIQSFKVQARFETKAALQKVDENTRKELKKKHYRVYRETVGNKVFMHARKKTMGPFGSDIVHLGILIILLGGIISGLGGFRQMLTISQGQVVDVPQADFRLKLDKFETEYYPDGRVRDWKSTLTILEGEESIKTQIVEVNFPLSYKGFVFYQSEYGWDWRNPTLEIWVKKKSEASYMGNIHLKIGQSAVIEGTDMKVTLVRFEPDFVIVESGRYGSRSNRPNNPAAFIEGWLAGEKIFDGWIFALHPGFSMMHGEESSDISFELKDFSAAQYSGIQAARDPGVNLIWIGSAALMLGLAVAFYWPVREIKIILEDKNGKVGLIAGGIASKEKNSFQIEFDNLIQTIRKTK